MKKLAFFGAAFTALGSGVQAQQPASPIQAIAPSSNSAQATLPANTEVLVSMNEELTTKGGKVEVGSKFRLTVVNDVKLGEYIVVPRGTPATGEVTWKTGKGAFGKSGKMEIDLRHIDLNGRVIPITGHYRQEGEGNTVGTVAGVIAAGVFAGFVTGQSALIPQGRELKAFTSEAIPVVLPAGAVIAPSAAAPIVATPAAAATSTAVPASKSN
jgi:hypothetical protein